MKETRGRSSIRTLDGCAHRFFRRPWRRRFFSLTGTQPQGRPSSATAVLFLLGRSPLFVRDILEHTMKARRLLLIVTLAMPCSLAVASGPASPAPLPELAADRIGNSASVGSDL